jgi:glutathione peroxidase
MTAQASASIYGFSATGIDGNPVSLSTYKDKVLLIVNTASQCGFTPQYKGLQQLSDQYANRGLVVLGFPCNQFGQQEPGNSDQIQSLSKAVLGILGTEGIKWNFTKFLVDRSGKVVKRYPPTAKPEDLVKDIQALL